MISGQTSIVNIKGTHNHPINIKRSKPSTQIIRRQHTGTSRIRDMKVELLQDDNYQDFIIEEEDDEIN